MNLITTAYNGAIEGCREFVTPQEKCEGTLARYHIGLPHILFVGSTVATIALPILNADMNLQNNLEMICFSGGVALGAIKAADGFLEIYRDPTPFNHIFNALIFQRMWAPVGGFLLAKTLCPIVTNFNPLNSGIITLGAGFIGAAASGIAKKFIEG